jgi:hypothetical protein
MGSNETATATTGGPRVIAYLTVTGSHRDQISYFFWMQIGPRTPTGVALIVGSHLHRMRWRLGLSRELWIENFGGSWSRLICMHRWKPPRVRCRRLRTSTTDQKRPLGDLRAAANRQDSIDAAVMAGPSISRIKEIIFFAPQ